MRRVTAAALALACVAAGVIGVSEARDRDDRGAQPSRSRPPQIAPNAPTRRPPVRLTARPLQPLREPVQDAAAASMARGGVALLGGLTAADVSTDRIHVVSSGRVVERARLPGALHDAAAVALGGAAYLFGGGNGVAQLASIVRFEPASGRVAEAGRLPVASSDVAAAALGGTAYVVGGYTGTRWLDSILAWRPGRAPRVVARLPTPLRYAAVTAAGGRLVIAGGSTPAGTASGAVLAFDPASGRVSRIGSLPAPTTHAAAATIAGVAYVIGGRGPSPNTPTARIVAVDPLRARVKGAGRLPSPRSDLAAASVPGGILVAGGRGRHGPLSDVDKLVPARVRGVRSRPAANVYAADGAGMLSPVVRNDPPRIYVPNSESGTVDVIDPRTFKIVEHFAVGALPQHVTPSYDLRTLYVLNDEGNSVTPIDPRTTRPGRPIPVQDPYNMYYTTDGRYAIVVEERNRILDFRDAHTLREHHALSVPCSGVDHVDFSADGRYLVASCEFSSQMLEVDVRRERVVGVLTVDGGAGMPQDVKLSPDGRLFYVADMAAGGLWEIDAARFRVVGFLPTGRGVHGLYTSRDARLMYATNRGEGSISVISFATRREVAKWWIPGGGSPDMGNVSADGKVLWLSGRYSSEVYAIDTRTGRLVARIHVGIGPHGLCVWPQPGRYSLGHTGVLR